jgi:photosystem II stability/assembly factor-like uncharacterized protein
MRRHLRPTGGWLALILVLAVAALPAACDSGPPDSTTPIAAITAAPTPNAGAAVIAAATQRPWWYGLHMLAAGDGWAVGKQPNGDAAIMHYTGGQWQPVPIAAQKTVLRGVWMVSPTDGWAVGERTRGDGSVGGAIFHYTGGQWADVPVTTDIRLYAVQMVSAGEGWACGVFGLLHYSGGQWTPVAVPTEVPVQMQGLAMLSPTEGWIIGKADDDGPDIALHYADGRWSSQRLSARAAVSGIQMLSPAEGWAAGTFGILHYTGGTWRRVERPVAKPLHDIAMASPTEGWIAGSFQNTPPTGSLLLHYSGDQWEVVDTGATQPPDPNDPAALSLGADLYAIQMVSSSEGWAVGALDTILHLQDGAWTRYAPAATPEGAP